MFIYKIKFLGGSETVFRANSPKEAWESASKQYELEVIQIKYIGGK